ncbi:hypothetical protein PLICRDRAFT_40032 [Plicaturopsis crispa FD-325 SS-3]|nr:hypothetical protein PLICRDRAFT_40032 [Plicaturopsis crispa FD-325 SS-3]
MAETLLALLLVTSSAKGSSLVYRWPPSPTSSTRLSRPKPPNVLDPSQLDNPWRAATFSEQGNGVNGIVPIPAIGEDDNDYEWTRPDTSRDRSVSFSRVASRPSSGRNSPSKDEVYDTDHVDDGPVKDDDFDGLFGYSSEFLAGLLCPQRSLCHQKFEMVVDDLAFIGHPVCAETDGTWQFKADKNRPGARGRGFRNRQPSTVDEENITPISPDVSSPGELRPPVKTAWLQTFHFVVVLDKPDPSSSASGNVSKYFSLIYEQIAFTITAVLFQEQVLSNFVEAECDVLGALKDEYMKKGVPFSKYMEDAMNASTIAPAMRTLWEAIKNSTVANLTINALPLEVQLPPYLDTLLHSEEESEQDLVDFRDEIENSAWGPEMGFGWRLPALNPWKSLLLLDDPSEHIVDPSLGLSGVPANSEERALAEGLVRFFETASVTVSLADMASALDWDLEAQVFPTVRWLVQHRRAKVVDRVHSGLKTVFVLPPKFDTPLAKLSEEFAEAFSHASIMSLPELLSAISKQSDTHFFEAVVHDKRLIPLYRDVVLWMLKRDLLITLRLRIRVVATAELKERVSTARERSRAVKRKSSKTRRKGTDDGHAVVLPPHESSGIAWLSLSPKSARRHSRRLPSTDSGSSKASDLTGSAIWEDEKDAYAEEEEEEGDSEGDEVLADPREHDFTPSVISDPFTATPLERRWLSAMSEDMEPHLAKRFELINRYFDGKTTDDEILYQTGISRKQLREVLHHYETYLKTFTHPS